MLDFKDAHRVGWPARSTNTDAVHARPIQLRLKRHAKDVRAPKGDTIWQTQDSESDEFIATGRWSNRAG
jgi:hypothetical protein